MNRAPSCLVLSCFQVASLLEARQAGETSARISTDLGLTTEVAELRADRVYFASGESLAWEGVREIRDNRTACYCVKDDAPQAIRDYSGLLGRVYSLMPTESAPTMLISGIPMHRIKGVNPRQDTLNKIEAIAPLRGIVLDTATGLGYTAIEAAKTAERVITIELDRVALGIARQNPWSRALFDNPKIEQIVGDSCEEIERFESGLFSCIIHDPPAFSLAGDLYSRAFYEQALRVLKRNGRMFHYVGDPQSKSGQRTTKGVARRLQEAGFTRVVHKPQAFGLLAYKG